MSRPPNTLLTPEEYLAKVPMYRTIPSLRECLLIAQDQHYVELYCGFGGGDWSLLDARGGDSSIELTSIGYTLRLEELYETAFPPNQ